MVITPVKIGCLYVAGKHTIGLFKRLMTILEYLKSRESA